MRRWFRELLAGFRTFRLWPRRRYLQPVLEVSYDGGRTWARCVGWDSLPTNKKHVSHVIGWQ